MRTGDSAFVTYTSSGWQGKLDSRGQAGDARAYAGNGYKIEAGMRFRKLIFPPDSIFSSAKLKLTASESLIEDVVNAKIHIQDSINAKPFTGTYDDYNARPRLAGEVEWNVSEWVPWTVYESPDLSSIFQGFVEAHNGLQLANMVIFYGDLEGLTPVPSARHANWIQWMTSVLHIEFSSEMGIPVQMARNNFTLSETEVQDFYYELSDDQISNDVRFLVPHYNTRIDLTQDPPVIVPVDFIYCIGDGLSQQKYGRRTNLIRGRYPSEWGGPAVTKANLEEYKEPRMIARAVIMGKDNATILKCLNTRISDKYHVDIGDVDADFWVDGINLIMDKVPVMTLNLSEIKTKETGKIFTLDEDVLDGEAVLG